MRTHIQTVNSTNCHVFGFGVELAGEIIHSPQKRAVFILQQSAVADHVISEIVSSVCGNTNRTLSPQNKINSVQKVEGDDIFSNR